MLRQYFLAENESAGLPVNVPTTELTDEFVQVIVDCTADFRTSELILKEISLSTHFICEQFCFNCTACRGF